ncbi:alpha/beta hydrolase family protein [Falsiroseomonas oryzae]|uniref:alpha/beta hydrolase family protein n=1 Tax=Falsiroseomonas oryzae TaxID=2766473 RepID=UPI0022EA6E7F|nr:prolyl oligopeptidase family serine peptidase [Roseomonas sp. MO-31]
MFEYFPNHYSWNLGLLMALQLGGELTEIDAACRHLIEVARRPNVREDPEAQALWVAAWSGLADRVTALAARDEAAGFTMGAGRKHLRAAVYAFTAERMAPHASPHKAALYARMLDSFARGVALRREPVEFVEIPYAGTTLPALFHRAPGPGPRPVIIHFDGFDVTKEWVHLCGVAREYALRGIATLMVDHPGVGGALRLRGLPTSPESERWAAAALDWLETRGDVDAQRVGVAAMSLGGYYAPRAAAFERRLACCIAWGARWDNALSHGRILRDAGAERSITGWVDHAMWVYGARDREDLAARIAALTLEGVAERITCPLLVVHGENDRQVPADQAQRTIDAAVNSPRRDLRVFTRAEGGAEHVQGDLFANAVDLMADWAAEVLEA